MPKRTAADHLQPYMLTHRWPKISSDSGQIRDTKPKTGQMGVPGELWFFRDTSLKVVTVPENPGQMVTSPAYRYGDKRRLLYFSRVIFFVHRSFDMPRPIFAKLCHTTRYVLKYFTSYMGDHMCPLKIWGAKTPNFCRFADPKSTVWATPFHNAREICKSKIIVSICDQVGTSTVHTKHGGDPTAHTKSVVPLMCGVGR